MDLHENLFYINSDMNQWERWLLLESENKVQIWHTLAVMTMCEDPGVKIGAWDWRQGWHFRWTVAT